MVVLSIAYSVRPVIEFAVQAGWILSAEIKLRS
jgi:hypothetical protein